MTLPSNLTDQSASLYVGNLDPRMSEPLLSELFAGVGPLLRVKLMGGDKQHASASPKYGFVEFADRKTAELALAAFNGKKIFNNEIKVNWAHGSQNGSSVSNREDSSSSYVHIFVGDLSNEVDERVLASAFMGFPSFYDSRVMWDSVSGKSRGYGFVSFRDRDDAEKAIISMNGKFIGGRAIRTNWANHKSSSPSNGTASSSSSLSPSSPAKQPQPTFQSISSQTVPGNTTVYVGNLTPFTSQNQLIPLFQSFGVIVDFRLHADRGYAFITFETHDTATMAIMCLNGTPVNGRNIRCSWGKEKHLPAPSQSSPILPASPSDPHSPTQTALFSSSNFFNYSPDLLHSASFSEFSSGRSTNSFQDSLNFMGLKPYGMRRDLDLFEKSNFLPFCRNF